jgi:hypothetical protein
MTKKNAEIRPHEGAVAAALYRFALLANKTSPHPRDWKRFYEFVVLAHARRSSIDADDINRKLREFGFDQRPAYDFATAYWHGRCVLYMRISRPITDSHINRMRKSGTAWT